MLSAAAFPSHVHAYREAPRALSTGAVLLIGLFCAGRTAESQSVRVAVEDRSFAADRSAASELTATPALAVSPRNDVVVLQPQENVVRIFDGDGSFIGVRGRTGSGPGEFRRPIRLGFVGDTLWVLDGVLRRVSLFSASWKHLETSAWASLLSRSGTRFNVKSPPEHIVALLQGGSILFQHSSAESPVSQESAVFVRPAVGSDIEVGSLGPTIAVMEVSSFEGGRTLRMIDHYAQTDHFAVAQDGSSFVLAKVERQSPDSVFARISVFDATGTLRYDREIALRRRPPSIAEVEQAVQRFRQRRMRYPDISQLTQAFRHRIEQRRYAPGFRKILIGEDGRVWLQTGGGIDERWLVLDDMGHSLWELEFIRPLDRDVLQANGSTIWAIERDADDLPTLHRYRIDSSGRRSSGNP